MRMCYALPAIVAGCSFMSSNSLAQQASPDDDKISEITVTAKRVAITRPAGRSFSTFSIHCPWLPQAILPRDGRKRGG